MNPLVILTLSLSFVATVHSIPCDTPEQQLDDNFCVISPVEGETMPMTFEDAVQFCAEEDAFLVSYICFVDYDPVLVCK